MRKIATLVGVLAASGAAVAAGPTFVMSKGDTLFRVIGGTTWEIPIADVLNGSTIADDGSWIVSSGTPDGNFELYELVDPVSVTPSLMQIGTTSTRVPTMANVGGTVFGVTAVDVG